MLDRTQDDTAGETAASAHPARPIRPWSRLGRVMARAVRAVVNRSFSSLTRRIVLLNLVGLVALVSGILWLSQFRQGLIESRAQSLLVQGEIIAGAIAASTSVEGPVIPIDPDKLFELQLGGAASAVDDPSALLEFPINPERVAPVLRRLTGPTETQARIYDREGNLILDSRNLYGRVTSRRSTCLRSGPSRPSTRSGGTRCAASCAAAAISRSTATSACATAAPIRRWRRR